MTSAARDGFEQPPATGSSAAGRAGMQRMIGRERRADLEIGDDARVEPLGERDARVPGFDAARDAAGKDDRAALRRAADRRPASIMLGRRGACRPAA